MAINFSTKQHFIFWFYKKVEKKKKVIKKSLDLFGLLLMIIWILEVLVNLWNNYLICELMELLINVTVSGLTVDTPALPKRCVSH